MQTVLGKLWETITSVNPVDMLGGVLLRLDHATADSDFNFCASLPLLHIIFEWRNTKDAECMNFCQWTFVVDPVVDGVSAQRCRHLPVPPDHKREAPLSFKIQSRSTECDIKMLTVVGILKCHSQGLPILLTRPIKRHPQSTRCTATPLPILSTVQNPWFGVLIAPP